MASITPRNLPSDRLERLRATAGSHGRSVQNEIVEDDGHRATDFGRTTAGVIPGAELARRIRLGEDSTLELKRVLLGGDRVTSPRRSDFADELAALANARGGTVVLGVDDKTRQIQLVVSMLARCPAPSGLGRMNLMDRRGDGLPIIRRETPRLAGSLPEYTLIDDSELRLVIPSARSPVEA